MVNNNWSNYHGLIFVLIIIVHNYTITLWCGLSFQRVEMSLTVNAFVSSPKLNELAMLKMSELVMLEN